MFLLYNYVSKKQGDKMKYLWITTSLLLGAILFIGCTDEEIEKAFTEEDDGSSVTSPLKFVDAHNIKGHKISAYNKISLIEYRVSVEFKCDGSFIQINSVGSIVNTKESESFSGDEINFSGEKEDRRMTWKGINNHNSDKGEKSSYLTLDKNDNIFIGTSYIDVLKINKIEKVSDCNL